MAQLRRSDTTHLSAGATTNRFAAPGRPVLAYDDLGDPDAPAVVMLHGLTECRTTWHRVASRLAKTYRVLLLDQRVVPGPRPMMSRIVGSDPSP